MMAHRPWYPLDRRLGEPQNRFDAVAKRKSLPVPVITDPGRTANGSQSHWLSYPWLCRSLFFVALQSLKDLGRLTYEVSRTIETDGRIPWTSNQPVARALPTQDNTTQEDADKHPYFERDSNPRSQQPTGQDPRLRSHGHCDRRLCGSAFPNLRERGVIART
jgi:hypothetical protein